jgi:CoA:oxalate CoA-transferase
MSNAPLPLDDIRVLDLTHYYHGPYATMLLSYLGAEVIKIEMPGVGDGMRPLYRRKDQPFGIPFALMNSNKRAITLNLKSDEGKEIFKRLVRKADLVVENFEAGTMDKLGLGYDVLREVNPMIVYACGTGYGISGPNRNLPAFDPVVQANTGFMAITGEIDGPPLKSGAAVVDLLGATHLFAAILAALRQRDRTGKGLMVETSLQESSLAALSTHVGAYYGMGARQLRDGNRAAGGAISPYNAYPATDGWIMILADNSRWHKLCAVIGQPELADDPRFATMAERARNRDEVDRIVAGWTRTRTRQQIMDAMAAAGVFAGIVKELHEVMTDPHLHERGALREIDHPDLGPMTIFTSPLRLNGQPNVPRSPAPALGRDTDAFYTEEFGFSPAEIAALRTRKVI